ncbi:MAG: site-specific integrase [Actinomycetota bacterium]|nr:site-specific integrase [Actinomycetota bacterium]
MSRNANGEGSIYVWRRDGKPDGYKGAISYQDEDGATKRYVAYGRTRGQVRAKLDAARERLNAGAPVKDASRSVADWLAHWRATTLAASDRSQSTRSLYATLARKHLEPAPFGEIRLDKLRPSDVEALILRMRAKTKPGKRTEDGTEPEPARALSDSTIRQVYTVLRAALDGAVRDGLVARNAAALVRRPGVERHEAKHLDAAAVTAVLRAAVASRYHAALTLIASTGLRRGECLALRWDRVDLDAGVLKVAATIGRLDGRLVITEPKTDRSRRPVPLSPPVVALLRKQKAAQAADKLRAGNQWHDSGLVFTTELGRPVDPRSLLRVVEAAAKAAGVAGVGVHTLRHSVAVGWLESGVHIKAVADLLGHSSISITGDIYGHTTDTAARSAVDGWSGALGL